MADKHPSLLSPSSLARYWLAAGLGSRSEVADGCRNLLREIFWPTEAGHHAVFTDAVLESLQQSLLPRRLERLGVGYRVVASDERHNQGFGLLRRFILKFRNGLRGAVRNTSVS